MIFNVKFVSHIFTLTIFVCLISSLTFGDDCSAPYLGAAHSGAPGEVNCSGCHSGTPNTGPGSVIYNIGNNTTQYVPGDLYTILLTMVQEDVNQFGFQTTALKNSNNSTAGDFILIDADETRLLYGNNREYVGHTVCGADANSPGSKQWSFQWEAPDSDVGDINFYLSSLATNHNHSSYGDDTYVQTITLSPLLTGTIDVAYMEGWNLVGLPLEVENTSYFGLFPESIEGTLYSFDNGYNPETILINGEGYWLRFENAGYVTIIGISISELIISLNEGWNLIAGISNPLNISYIQDPDGIIISGTIYGFNSGGYSNSNSIEPGKGYWVRANNSGLITLIDN